MTTRSKGDNRYRDNFVQAPEIDEFAIVNFLVINLNAEDRLAGQHVSNVHGSGGGSVDRVEAVAEAQCIEGNETTCGADSPHTAAFHQ